MKILLSNTVTLNLFCKNPLPILEASKNGIVEVLRDDSTVFYAVTPGVLQKIFDIEYNVSYEDSIKKNTYEKFSMHDKWTPDKDFVRKSALWGIILHEEISESELASFISYWKAEGCFFHHIQWQQKFARSLQKTRSYNQFSQKKRDITYIPTPDKTIPSGFRGK
ncbi:primosomal protein DnaT [Buchnera aphidicola]|uniref:primosomal protein DnaT n=1 Tax=Buchnera aphidicola TaxID=9 RepID=UPI003463DA94